MNNQPSIIWLWLTLALFPILFTAWGWRNVVLPYIWPAIKFCFGTIRVIFWVGFTITIFATPITYKTWGFTIWHILLKAVYTRNEYDAWVRQYAAEYGVHHALPAWTVLLAFAAVFIFVRYRKHKNEGPTATIIRTSQDDMEPWSHTAPTIEVQRDYRMNIVPSQLLSPPEYPTPTETQVVVYHCLVKSPYNLSADQAAGFATKYKDMEIDAAFKLIDEHLRSNNG